MNFPPFNTQFVKVSVGDTVRAGTPYCQTYPGGTALYISEAVISFEVDASSPNTYVPLPIQHSLPSTIGSVVATKVGTMVLIYTPNEGPQWITVSGMRSYMDAYIEKNLIAVLYVAGQESSKNYSRPIAEDSPPLVGGGGIGSCDRLSRHVSLIL